MKEIYEDATGYVSCNPKTNYKTYDLETEVTVIRSRWEQLGGFSDEPDLDDKEVARLEFKKKLDLID